MVKDWPRVYIERLPVWLFDGEDLTPDKTLFTTTFKIGVRRKRDRNGAREALPGIGSIAKLNMFYGKRDLNEHKVIDNEMYYGRVEDIGKAWLDATGCDFCVRATKPR